MSKFFGINDCHIFALPKIKADTGSITSIHNSIEIPFDVKRVFYLFDIPSGESRGAHAHIECHQFLIAASGSFEVVLEDGVAKKTITLNQPDCGLHIPPGVWAHEQNFSSGAICLVLASEKYSELDYIRDYDKFLNFRGIR